MSTLIGSYKFSDFIEKKDQNTNQATEPKRETGRTLVGSYKISDFFSSPIVTAEQAKAEVRRRQPQFNQYILTGNEIIDKRNALRVSKGLSPSFSSAEDMRNQLRIEQNRQPSVNITRQNKEALNSIDARLDEINSRIGELIGQGYALGTEDGSDPVQQAFEINKEINSLKKEKQRGEAAKKFAEENSDYINILVSGAKDLFEELYNIDYNTQGTLLNNIGMALSGTTSISAGDSIASDNARRNEIITELRARGLDPDRYYAAYKNSRNSENAQELQQYISEFAEKHPVISSVASAATAPVRGMTAALGMVMDPGANSPYQFFNQVSSAVAGTVTEKISGSLENIAKEHGAGDKAAYYLGKAGAWIYSAGVSSAESLLTMTAGGPFGEVLMGLNAATQTYDVALNNGLDMTHATVSAFGAGIFEAVFEHISLEKLRVMQTSGKTGVKNFVFDIGKQFVTEGSEEALTDIFNGITDYLYNGGLSDYERTVAEYKEQGLSDEEARKKAAIDFGLQVGESFIVGGLSGAMMGGTVSAANNAKVVTDTYQLGKVVKTAAKNTDGGIKTLIEGLQIDAGKINDDTSTYKTGKIVNAAIEATKSESSKVLSEALMERGLSKDKANSLSEAFVNFTTGTASVADLSIVFSNDGMSEIVYQALEGETNETFKKNNETIAQFYKTLGEQLEKSGTRFSFKAIERIKSKFSKTRNVAEAAENAETAKNAAEATKTKTTEKLVKDGYRGATSELGEINLYGIKTAENGEIEIEIDKESGATVKLSDVSFENSPYGEEGKKVFETLKDMINGTGYRTKMSVEGANIALSMLHNSSEVNAAEFLNEWQQTYYAGSVGMNPETYKVNLTLNDVLTDTQLDAAYEAGTADLSLRPGVTRIGSRTLTKAQVEEIAVIDKLMEEMGITFVLTDKVFGSNGKGRFEAYGNTDGKTINAALFTGNSTDGNVVIITAGHELYHWIKFQSGASAEQQRALTKMVNNFLKSSDKFDYDAIYEQRKNAYPDYTQEQIEEEIAAQYFGALLADKYFSREVIKSDITFWGRAIEHLKEFVNKIRARLEEYFKKTDDKAVKAAIETDLESAEQFITSFEAVLKTAIEESNNKKTADGGEVKEYSFLLSQNGLAHSDLQDYTDELKDIINKHGDIIIDSKAKLAEFVDEVYDIPKSKKVGYFGIISKEKLREIENSIVNKPKDLTSVFAVDRDCSIVVNADGIRHLKNERKWSKQEVVDYLDLLPDTILDADDITFHYYERGSTKENGLLFKKQINGSKQISFEVISNKKHWMRMQTMYIQDIQNKRSLLTQADDNTSAYVQNEGSQTSMDIISDVEEKSNTQNEENSRVLNQNALDYVDRLKGGSRQQWEKIDILTGLAENAKGIEISDAALRKIAQKYDFSEKNRAEIRQMAEGLKAASGMLDTAANIDTVLYGLYMIARNEYENAGHWESIDDISKQFRQEFRSNGKMKNIYIPTDIYNTVAEYYGGRAAFRRAMFGKMNITNDRSKNAMGLDVFYDSLLQGNYGLEATTDPTTQINNILALYNADTKYWVDDSDALAMAGESLDEKATDTAFDMLEDIIISDRKLSLPENAALNRINELQLEIKKERQEGIQSVITRADAELQQRLDELSKSGKDTVAIEVERERLKNEYRLKGIQDAYRRRAEALEREYAEREQKEALRRDIKRNIKALTNRFTRESDSNNVPEELKKNVLEFLNMFGDDRSILTANAMHGLLDYTRRLQDTGKNAPEDGTESFFGRFDEEIREELQSLAERIRKIEGAEHELKVYTSALSLDEMKTVANAAEHIRFIIENANAAFINGRMQSVSTVGDKFITELDNKKRTKLSRKTDNTLIGDYINNKMLTPIYFFNEKIGGEMAKLYEGFRDGQDEWYKRILKGKDILQEAKKKYNYDKWKNEKKTFHYDATLSRKEWTVQLSVEERMQIYVTAKRETAAGMESKHLTMGGIVLQNELKKKSFVEKMKGLIKKNAGAEEALSEFDKQVKADRHMLSLEELIEIGNSLTDEQKAYADEIVQFMSTVCSDWGNDATMKLSGIKKFNEKYYFPYQSARNYLYTRLGVSDDTRLKNAGFTKKTTFGANSPLVVSGFTEVAANHIQQMALFSTMTVPIDTLQRVINYQPVEIDENGNKVKKQGNVKTALTNAYGKEALSYINTFVTQVNGGIRSDSLDNLWNKWTGRFKRAAVMGNLSVVVQQPTALMRAMALINPKYFFGSFRFADFKDMMDHSAVAGIKQMGGFDTNTGRSAAEWMIDESSVAEKISDKMGKGAEVADAVTWTNIWNAVKRETLDKHSELKYGSDEFYEVCEKRFRDICDYTQVYDSTLSKSELMRGQGSLTKMITAFMAEPTLSFNLISQSGLKKNGRKINKGIALGAFLANIMVNSAAKGIVGAWRDKDEDITYREKWLSRFFGDLVGDKNVLFLDGAWSPFGLIPWVKDLVSLWQGYDVDRADVSVLSDFIAAAHGFWSEMNSGEDGLAKPSLNAFIDLVGSISAITPMPLTKIMQDVEGLYQSVYKGIKRYKNHELRYSLYSDVNAILEGMGFDKSNAETVYKAVLAKDSETESRYTAVDASKVKGYIEDGYSENDAIAQAEYDALKSYYNLMQQGLIAFDERILQAAEAKYSGEYKTYEQLMKQIINDGFPQYAVQTSIDKLVEEMRPEDIDVDELKDKKAYTNKDLYDTLDIENVQRYKYVKEQLTKAGVKENTIKNNTVNYVKDLYFETVERDRAKKLLTKFAGFSDEDADEKISFWDYQIVNPSGTLNDAAYKSYYEKVKSSGISVKTYERYYALQKDVVGIDEDGDGEVDKDSCWNQIVAIIYEFSKEPYKLTTEQMDVLYLLRYKEKYLSKTKWHQP